MERSATLSARIHASLIRIGFALAGISVAVLVGECAVRLLGVAPVIAFLSEGQYRLSSNVAIAYEPIPNLGVAV